MKYLVSFFWVGLQLTFYSEAFSQTAKPEFIKGKTSYYRTYAKKAGYQKEKDYCEIKFGAGFRQIGAQSEEMCDNPKSKTCAFQCTTEKEFDLKGAELEKIKSDFEKFKKENDKKIPSEQLSESQLHTAYNNRGIAIVNSSNLLKCPAGTKASGNFHFSYSGGFPLRSGELSCTSESIPMSQICPEKGKRVRDSNADWICGTNICKGKLVYDNERYHHVCVECAQGTPDFDESLSWRNSDKFPEKCRNTNEPACVLCRVN